MMLALLMLGLVQTTPVGTAAWKERHLPDMPKIPPCTFARSSKEVGRLTELPAQVRMEVARFFNAGGGLADAGGEFNSTDYIDDRRVPSRRFVRAYLTEDVWFIWYETGGFVHGLNTLALTRQRDADGVATIYRATPGSGFTGDLCAGSRAFLSGVRAASGM